MNQKIKLYLYGGLAVLVLIFAFSAYKACRITDEMSHLRGQYDILKKQAEQNEAEFAKQIKEYEKATVEKDKVIEKQKKLIEDKNKDIAKNDAKIKGLEAEREKLKDKDAIIANLDSQVNFWKAQFSLCQDIIASKDAIIFNLTEKYEAQAKISVAYKVNWESEKELRLLAEKRLKLAERSLIVARFWSNLKTATIVAAVCYVIGSTIAK